MSDAYFRKRQGIISFRMSYHEFNELAETAKLRKKTMSFLVREALEEKYPEIFRAAGKANRRRYYPGQR